MTNFSPHDTFSPNHIGETHSNLIMPRFDTLKVAVPKAALKRVDRRRFKKMTMEDADGVTTEKLVWDFYRSKTVGITGIEINRNEAIFEISSKILLDRYPELINRNNIRDVLTALKTQSLVEFDLDEFLNTARVFKCDVTMNLRVSKDVKLYTQALNYIYSPAFSRDSSKRGTVEFYKNKKEGDGHLTAYDKEDELKKYENREFLDSLLEPSILIKWFHNILRVERKFSNFKHMRNAFDLEKGAPYFRDILASTENPILDLFLKIKFYPQPDFINSDDSIGKIIRNKGLQKIVEEFNYDAEALYAWIRSKTTNSSSVIPKFRKVLEKPKVITEGVTQVELLDEMERLIRHGQ